MQRSYHKWIPAVVAVLLFLGASEHVPADPKTAADQQNQCLICHTHVKGLIRLSWEVEKLRPRKAPSSETSGEG